MTAYERIRYELIWAPLVFGLDVIEPQTELEKNLAWFDFKRASEAMDDVLDYASKLKEST